MQLGRALGFETLYFRASPLDLSGNFIGELVDLRPPPSGATSQPTGDDGGSPRLNPGRWNERVASEYAREFYAQRLSLRDPLAPSDERRARECRIPATAPFRLACAGHISWSARFEPERQQSCVPLNGSAGAG